MYNPLLALGLATLAAATTPTTLNTGFILVAHVTNPDQDFTPSVNNAVVNSNHAGPGFRVATVSSSLTDGHIFYENGTLGQAADGETTIIFDAATPPQPHPEPRPVLVNGLGEGTYLVCNATVPYYQRNFLTLQYAYESQTVPDSCVRIELVPQCAELNELPPGSHSSHEHALNFLAAATAQRRRRKGQANATGASPVAFTTAEQRIHSDFNHIRVLAPAPR
ncbi:hypothetical protein B0T21DRAFT_414978 [Apiosordaria backusii]|uniref:DUF7907 domain-containing protein n=1 Tax=Apiosordaria backusii TaxID=314023 RepID=A0AA40AN82_9PEZI|nr:hypothetical protein B0T21DRAFT_414978 [Apiosordaria backusii]